VEFTVEPFVDASPGAHVRAAWQAVEAHGCELIQGPFSAETSVEVSDAHIILGDVLRAALANGATHLAFLVDLVDDDGGPAGPLEIDA
jgi:hypothetical protein